MTPQGHSHALLLKVALPDRRPVSNARFRVVSLKRIGRP
jgi:hypothetical protein